VANDDDQGHANRQNRDISHLIDQVADVAGGDEDPICRNRKKGHNEDQRDKHEILADVGRGQFYEVLKK
jgi:hypothetical protein